MIGCLMLGTLVALGVGRMIRHHHHGCHNQADGTDRCIYVHFFTCQVTIGPYLLMCSRLSTYPCSSVVYLSGNVCLYLRHNLLHKNPCLFFLITHHWPENKRRPRR